MADLIRPFSRRAPLTPVAALRCERREFALRANAGPTLALLRDDKVTVRRGGLTTARYREVMLDAGRTGAGSAAGGLARPVPDRRGRHGAHAVPAAGPSARRPRHRTHRLPRGAALRSGGPVQLVRLRRSWRCGCGSCSPRICDCAAGRRPAPRTWCPPVTDTAPRAGRSPQRVGPELDGGPARRAGLVGRRSRRHQRRARGADDVSAPRGALPQPAGPAGGCSPRRPDRGRRGRADPRRAHRPGGRRRGADDPGDGPVGGRRSGPRMGRGVGPAERLRHGGRRGRTPLSRRDGAAPRADRPLPAAARAGAPVQRLGRGGHARGRRFDPGRGLRTGSGVRAHPGGPRRPPAPRSWSAGRRPAGNWTREGFRDGHLRRPGGRRRGRQIHPARPALRLARGARGEGGPDLRAGRHGRRSADPAAGPRPGHRPPLGARGGAAVRRRQGPTRRRRGPSPRWPPAPWWSATGTSTR